MKDSIKNIPFYITIIIIFHHYFKHKRNKQLSVIDKIIQFKDINNHETWALFFLGIGIGMLFK